MDESAAPTSEFAVPAASPAHRPRSALIAVGAQAALLLVSFVALLVALGSAALLLIVRLARFYPGSAPAFAWAPRSAVPLIAIGISYSALIFAIPKPALQRLMGCLVSLAFVLWGAEQYLHDQALIALMDDVVVFLFVLDLGLVVRDNLLKLKGRNT